ncbi:hypothetical protein LMG1866_05612 [Achromobacter ruhlandii]|nr:hypothetical protein LMG1866_05612 [Achromobacter ruhlandii]
MVSPDKRAGQEPAGQSSMAQNPAPMNRSVLTLPRFIAARLLWYAGVATLAAMALASQTLFSVAAVLSAIAIYIPVSMLALPLMAWLVLRRAPAEPPAALAPAWPCWLAAVAGIALLAGYHLSAWLELAEGGVLLLLIAVDLALARRESARLLDHLAARRPR